MKFCWQDFLDAITQRDDRAARRDLELPADMVLEIERLGEDRTRIEQLMRTEGVEFARAMLNHTAEEVALFKQWFPVLQQFAYEKRLASPLQDDALLSSVDHAICRVLGRKIKSEGALPQLRENRIPIFSAPLAVLPLVIAEWSSTYTNPVFLTTEELEEWNSIYRVDEDSPWWNFYYSWKAEPNPILDESWMANATAFVSQGVKPLLITWGSCVGALAGSWSRELWCIDTSGVETFIEDLGCVVA
jgi:hypothetical protein